MSWKTSYHGFRLCLSSQTVCKEFFLNICQGWEYFDKQNKVNHYTYTSIRSKFECQLTFSETEGWPLPYKPVQTTYILFDWKLEATTTVC